MINKKYLKNLRCKAINNKNDFIFDLLSERIVDSLEIISLDFEKILILGDDGTKICKYIKKKFKKSSLTIYDNKKIKSNYNDLYSFKEDIIDLDLWKNKKEEYNLVLSNLFLSLCDNIENIINKIMNSLIPNGFFLATLPSPENLNSLKSAMIQTDIEMYGGAYNRFNRTVDLKNMIDILKKENFKIPSVNLENIKLEYKDFDNLLHDVRSLNSSYHFEDKKNTFEKKNYFKKLEKNYKKNSKNYFELSLNFYVISGWKYHPSQQIPMKPGKAKNKLKDFL